MRKTKVSTNESWVNIFDKYDILNTVSSKGYADITADQIKAVDGKEARLMTKVDFRENLPTIMKENSLSILAIKNGLYRIAKNDPFIDINEKISTKIIEIEPPCDITSIDPFNIKSESAALDIAYISKMCEQVFNEESFLSIRGRLRGELAFDLDSIPYNIDGVQIEVDGGYEGNESIHLIEAKIGFRNNINIRQLLYPQLYWEKELNGSKKIKSYIFYLHNNIFRFIPYIYDGKIGYADHAEEKAFKFVEKASKFSIYDVEIDDSLVDSSVPFPQADKFEKIQDMLFVISQNECTNKYELNLEFDIVSRQIDYYLNVLKWLKVCKEEGECIVLTQKGKEIIDMPFKKRLQELSKIVFSEPIANNFLHKKEISDQMFGKYNMNSQSTQRRRLQTISAWINYFEDILELK
ncbi:hypothetical protein [Sulfurimonas sp.]|uniref:type II restriction enzyme n=1 Tax=Sulfurimonas sp. TaxID=2022749 RepID=UPI003566C989